MTIDLRPLQKLQRHVRAAGFAVTVAVHDRSRSSRLGRDDERADRLRKTS